MKMRLMPFEISFLFTFARQTMKEMQRSVDKQIKGREAILAPIFPCRYAAFNRLAHAVRRINVQTMLDEGFDSETWKNKI